MGVIAWGAGLVVGLVLAFMGFGWYVVVGTVGLAVGLWIGLNDNTSCSTCSLHTDET